jgi:Holliday junction resolvase RusA-like endonuclease
MYTRQDRVSITVPITPPSVNHYKKPVVYRTKTGIRRGFALTDEAKTFHEFIAVEARRTTLIPEDAKARKKTRYALFVKVYPGRLALRKNETKQRDEWGDGDNYWKCLADGLTGANVIHDDRYVKTWHMEVVEDDRDNPRTEIIAVVLDSPSFFRCIEELYRRIMGRKTNETAVL